MSDEADRMMDEAMDAADRVEVCERGHRYVDDGWGCYECELEAEELNQEEGEMYVYRVAVIVEDPETGRRERREFKAKASRMALAVQRTLDFDERVNTGRQGQDVGLVARKLGDLRDYPQESEVRPVGGDQ